MLGMVLVTTTLIDVVVVLGFDIAFTRFYFDDKSQRHRDEVITTEFWVSTVYPASFSASSPSSCRRSPAC